MPNRSGGQGDNLHDVVGSGSDRTRMPPRTDVARRAYGGSEPDGPSGSSSNQSGDSASLRWEKPQTPQDFQRGQAQPHAKDRSGPQGGPASEGPSYKGPLQKLRDAHHNVSSSRGPAWRQVTSPASSLDGPTISSPSDSGVFSASGDSVPVSPDWPRVHERIRDNTQGDDPRAPKRQRLVEDSLPTHAIEESDNIEQPQDRVTQLIQEQSKEVEEQLTRHALEESSQPDNIDLIREHMRENRKLEERHLSARETLEKEQLSAEQRSERIHRPQGTKTSENRDIEWKHAEQRYSLEWTLLKDKYTRLEDALKIQDSTKREDFTKLMREYSKKEYDLLMGQLNDRQIQEVTHLQERQKQIQGALPTLIASQITEKEKLELKQLNQRQELEFGFQDKQHKAERDFQPHEPGGYQLYRAERMYKMNIYRIQVEYIKSKYSVERGLPGRDNSPSKPEQIKIEAERIEKKYHVQINHVNAIHVLDIEQLKKSSLPDSAKEYADKYNKLEIGQKKVLLEIDIEYKQRQHLQTLLEPSHLQQRDILEKFLKAETDKIAQRIADFPEKEKYRGLLEQHLQETYVLLGKQLDERQAQHLPALLEQVRTGQSGLDLDQRRIMESNQLSAREALEKRQLEDLQEAERSLDPDKPKQGERHALEREHLEDRYRVEQEELTRRFTAERQIQQMGNSPQEIELGEMMEEHASALSSLLIKHLKQMQDLELKHFEEKLANPNVSQQRLDKEYHNLSQSHSDEWTLLTREYQTQENKLSSVLNRRNRGRTSESSRISTPEDPQLRELQKKEEGKYLAAYQSMEEEDLKNIQEAERRRSPYEVGQAERHGIEQKYLRELHDTFKNLLDEKYKLLKANEKIMNREKRKYYVDWVELYNKMKKILLRRQIQEREREDKRYLQERIERRLACQPEDDLDLKELSEKKVSMKKHIDARKAQERSYLAILHQGQRSYDPRERGQSARHRMELAHLEERYTVLAQTQQKIYDIEIANLSISPSLIAGQLKGLYIEHAQRESNMLQSQVEARHALEVERFNASHAEIYTQHDREYGELLRNQAQEQEDLAAYYRQSVQYLIDQERA